MDLHLLYNFTKKELLPLEDRGAYLVIGFTDEGSSFQYTQKRAEDVEKRLIPLLGNLKIVHIINF